MLETIGFYVLKNSNQSPGRNLQSRLLLAEIELNPVHEIFKGHFPGSPVLPGVCLIQLSKEILEKAIAAETVLLVSSQAKFLSVIDPTINKFLQIALEINEHDGIISAGSTISADEKIFFKFKGSFKKK